MSTHTRSTRAPASAYNGFEDFDLDALSTDELDALLFDEEEPPEPGFWNLSTVAGLSLIVVGVAYLMQEMGLLTGFDLSQLVALLPLFAGVLIILLGFGVLSWRPGRRRKKRRVKKAKEKLNAAISGTGRLTRSRHDRKMYGVCGGIAERLGMDPTLVRIAFVIGTIASGGWPFILAYFALAYVMPEPEDAPAGDRGDREDLGDKHVRVTRGCGW